MSYCNVRTVAWVGLAYWVVWLAGPLGQVRGPSPRFNGPTTNRATQRAPVIEQRPRTIEPRAPACCLPLREPVVVIIKNG
jgi:hypothetical protein